jgi:amino acid adenylation domain-containing protein
MGEAEAPQRALPEAVWQQLAAWNATEQSYPQDRCVPELVAAQAAATPEAVAVVARGQALTYGALNRRANQLAHLLRGLGVGPEVLVGVCVERSAELVIGLLAVLKAGGAYVPLDPQYPDERLRFMLQDADAPLLLTQRHLLPRLAAQASQALCLDADEPLWAAQPVCDPPPLARAEHLAYVIYTSGSTGRPKGVEITHRSLLNLIFWSHRTLGITPADRASQLMSPAFDVLGEELWPHLTAGASLYLADEEIRADAARLRDWMVAERITLGNVPNVLVEQLINLEWPPETALRLLLTGGDVLQQYPPLSLPFALLNSYGPTEATILTTRGRVPPLAQTDALPSIGRPIANAQVYLLDDDLQPVPIGEVGELYIGGAGLARGYRHQPALTAERFIWHAFRGEPAQRLYKTGDLARYRPDGDLEFLGRSDDQIKLRGFRIEPNEIVRVLDQHPAIQASVVIAREDQPGQKRLVAYLVLTPGVDVTPGALQAHLQAQLPEYMVPAVFVTLAALPPTLHGKVNRAALLAPDASNTLRERGSASPETALEAQVAAQVAALLQVESVGVEESFFLLGGNSLLGVQLLARVLDRFGVELNLSILFEAPTARQLAREIEQRLIARIEQMNEADIRRLLEQAPEK